METVTARESREDKCTMIDRAEQYSCVFLTPHPPTPPQISACSWSLTSVLTFSRNKFLRLKTLGIKTLLTGLLFGFSYAHEWGGQSEALSSCCSRCCVVMKPTLLVFICLFVTQIFKPQRNDLIISSKILSCARNMFERYHVLLV